VADRVARVSQVSSIEGMQSAGKRAHGAAIADASDGDVGSPVPPVRTGKKRGAGRWLLLLLGFATLGILLWEVNTQDLLARFLALGWSAPLLLWPYALIALVDGWAYSFTLPRNGVRRPPLPALIMIRLAGESVNTLTPTAYLGGEPVKAMLLVKRGITTASSTVSVVVAKTALTVGQVVFVLLGVMLTLERFDIVHHGDVLFVALCVGGAIFVALLVRWQQRGLFAKLARIAERVGLRGARFQRFASVAPDIDRELGGYYRTRGGDFAITTGLHFLGWLLGTVEVKVFADLLQYPISWRDAFIIEAISQPLSLGSALIPGALGVREAGGVAIFGMLGLDESVGLALWLLRRVREAAYNGIGLHYLMYATRRAATT
jgi:uncharacterized protein (TIRG00374 family)